MHVSALPFIVILCLGEMERALSEGLTIEDIPLTAATSTLLDFLRKVCVAIKFIYHK